MTVKFSTLWCVLFGAFTARLFFILLGQETDFNDLFVVAYFITMIWLFERFWPTISKKLTCASALGEPK